MDQRPVVLLTGFTPFQDIPVNAGWSAVQQINKEELENTLHIKIVAVEIPVVYNKIDAIIPELWKSNRPVLVIHVGVANQCTQLTLETRACGEQYQLVDNEGKLPEHAVNLRCQQDNKIIMCGLDVQKIVQKYNTLKNPLPTTTSSDAGRFLCEYTYYTSLSIDPSRTLFVHVPEITAQLTARQLAEGLEIIIALCLEQLRQSAGQTTSSV